MIEVRCRCGSTNEQVAGCGGVERGYRRGLLEPRRVGAPALEQVAQSLHHYAAAGQHVAELSYVAAVLYRLVERLSEPRRYQHGKVGIAGAQLLVVVAVAVDYRYAAVVVLLGHQSARVHAERAHLVLERVGVVDQFGLVQVLGQVIHYRIGHLDAHAYVYLVVGGFDLVGVGYLAEPRRAAAPGRGHYERRAHFLALALAADERYADHFAALGDDLIGGRVIAELERVENTPGSKNGNTLRAVLSRHAVRRRPYVQLVCLPRTRPSHDGCISAPACAVGIRM